MKRLLLLCGLTPVALLPATNTYIWKGATSSDMNTASNWIGTPGGLVPPASAAASFPASPSILTLNNTIPGYNMGSFTFSDAYTLTGNPLIVPAATGPALSFTTSGTTISPAAGITIDGTLAVFNSSTGSNTIGHIGSGSGLLSLQEGSLVISDASTFTGSINLLVLSTQSSGKDTVLQAGAANSFGTPTLVNLLSGKVSGSTYNSKLDLNNYDHTIKSLSGGTDTEVALGTATLTISAASQETPFYGVISGTGDLLVTGGSFASMGTNTFTGTTTMQGGGTLNTITLGSTSSIIFGAGSGILQLGSSFSSSIPFTFDDAGTIATNGFTVTLSGAMTGSGAFSKLGPGTLILTGANSNTGPLLIKGGILNVNSTSLPSTVGAITFESYGGTLQAGSDLTISQPVTLSIAATIDTNSYSVTMNGPISGGTRFIKKGAGTLTLGSPGNNFTGKTQIDKGTLNGSSTTFPARAGGTPQLVFSGAGDSIFQAGSDFTDFTSDIILESDGTIDTNSYDMTVSGTVAGKSHHTLSKIGAGSLIFTGEHSFSGTVLSTAGTFYANGILVGDVKAQGSKLKGTGTVQGTATIEGGILCPGNSVGTLTIGTLSLDTDSTTLIETDESNASKVVITGSATVDGALSIAPNPGAYPREGTYTILSADTLTGTFSTLPTSPGFTYGVSYSPTDITLSYFLSIPTTGLSGDDLTIANHLNATAPPSTAYTALAMLTGNALEKGLAAVSPARNATGTYITQQTAFSFNSLLMDHMDALRFREDSSKEEFLAGLMADASDNIQAHAKTAKRNTFSTWGSTFGKKAHQKASGQTPSFRFTSAGLLTGFDYLGKNRASAGGAIGYAHTYFNQNQDLGRGSINYYFASLYGNAFSGNFYFSPAVWGIFNQTKNVRHIFFPGFSDDAKANIYAWQLLPHLEVGYNAAFAWGNVSPFSSASWAITWQRGYSEKGTSHMNASMGSQSSSMVRSETGLKFSEKWDYSWGAFFLKEKASYIFQKPYGTGTVNSTLAGAPSTFIVTSLNQNLNLGSVGIDFTAAIGKSNPTSISLGYEGEFGSKYLSNQLRLDVRKDF
jgi:fibronectin-binding autotransporter adhesin